MRGDVQERSIVTALLFLLLTLQTWPLWLWAGFITLFTLCMCFVEEAAQNIAF